MSNFGGINTSTVHTSPVGSRDSFGAAVHSGATQSHGAPSPSSNSSPAGRSPGAGGTNDRGTSGMQQGSNNYNSQSNAEARNGGFGGGGGGNDRGNSFGGINTSTIHTAPEGSNSHDNNFGGFDTSRVHTSFPTQRSAVDYGGALQNYLTTMGHVRAVNGPLNTTNISETPSAEVLPDNLTTAYKTPAPMGMDYGEEIQNYLMAEGKARRSNLPASRSLALDTGIAGVTPPGKPTYGRGGLPSYAPNWASAPNTEMGFPKVPAKTAGIEDYSTGIPSNAVPVPRMKVDANLSFLKSRANPLASFDNMSPDFVNSFSTLARAAELQTGEKLKLANPSSAYRTQAMQADIRRRGLAQGFPSAPAGLSRHQYGSAIDVAPGAVRNAMAKMVRDGLAPGIQRAQRANDPPHFEEANATYTRSSRPKSSYSVASNEQQYSIPGTGTMIASKAAKPTQVASITKTRTTPARSAPVKQVGTSNILNDLISGGKQLAAGGAAVVDRIKAAAAPGLKKIKDLGGPVKALALAKMMQPQSPRTIARNPRRSEEQGGGDAAVLAFLRKYPGFTGASVA